MESTLVPALGIAVLVVLLALAVANQLRWRRRREQWAEVALKLGLSVRPGSDLLDRFAALPLFQKGRGRRVRNLVHGSAWGMEVWLADYRYATGTGNNQRTHQYTICVLHDPALALPSFALQPENPLSDRFAALLGLPEVDFADDPEFSRAYRLTGTDESAIRARFDRRIRSRLLENPARIAHIEGAGEALLVHPDKLIDPQAAHEILRQAQELRSVFRP